MNELNGFTISDYNVHGFKEGSTTAICPVCSHTRKPENQKVKCMSLFWETGLGVCNHCAEKRLQLHTYEKKQTNKTYLKPAISDSKLSISNELEKYAKDIRGISLDTLKRLKIHSSISWMPKAKKEINVIKIPYYFHGELINVKYRGANKDFMFEKGCEKIIYNIDAIIGEKECIITEGEPDAWSYDEVGLNYVCSVPNGFTLPRADGTSSINTDYLDNYYEIFEAKERIYLALDNDDAGKCGESELIRRFGAEKCWLVDFKDCKDANEYLIKYKDEALRQTIKDAKQVPLNYVETLKDFEQELDDFWINGSPKGYTTDVRDLDAIYSTDDSQFTIVTGPPTSGKSEVVDAICVGYAIKYGMKTAFASPENKPNKYHADKIIRKIAGFKPTTLNQVRSKSISRAKEFYNDHFFHVEFDSYSLKKTLSKFEELVKRKGVRCFVLDPYNKIKLKEAKSQKVEDYTNEYLNEIDMFCKKNQCIMYLVAHPVKMKKVEGTQTYEMPTAYHVKGGAEMYDMTYHMLGIVKDLEERLVRIKVLKVKFQHLGENEAESWVGWNINNGRYSECNFNPSEQEVGTPIWDNSDWLATNDEKEQIDSFDEKTGEVHIDYIENFEKIDDSPF